MATFRKSIADWLRETILKVTEDGNVCGALELFNVTLAGDVTLHKTLITSNMESLDPNKIANEIYNIAKTHSLGGWNIQNYKICAYRPEEVQPYTNYPFDLNGKVDIEGGTPEASKTGSIQQMMMFYQKGMEMIFSQQRMIFETQGAVITRLAQENDKLKVENISAVFMAKEIIMEKAANVQEHQLALLKEKEKSDLKTKFMELAPAIINTIFGREIIPVNAEDTAMINNIADNLTPEQIQMIPQLFGAQLGGYVAARLERRIQEKNLLKTDGMTEVKPNGNAS
jgi:hypothetical protein